MNKEQLETLKNRLDQFEKVYQAKKVKLQDQIEMISYEESLANEYIKKIQAYKSVISEMNKELTNNKESLDKLTNKNNSLDVMLSNLIKKRRHIQAQNQTIAEKLEVTKANLSRSQRKCQDESIQLKSEVEMYNKKREKLKAIKSALSKINDLYYSLNEKNSTLQKSISQLKESITKYLTSNQQAELSLKTLMLANKKINKEYEFIKNKESLLRQTWLEKNKHRKHLLEKNTKITEASHVLAQRYLDLRLEMEELEKSHSSNSARFIIEQ